MLKQFLKHSIVYSFGNVMTKGVGFLLVPVYLRFLSQEEYGVFDYVVSIGAIVVVVVTLEISQGVMRFVSEHQDQEALQNSYVATAFWFTASSFFLLTLAAFLFSRELSLILLDDVGREHILFFGVLAFSSNALVYFFSVVYRSKLQPRVSILISVSSVIAVAFFSLCALYFGYGVGGLLFSQFAAQMLVVGYIVWDNRIFFRPPDFFRLKELLAFSTPLVFSSLSVLLSIFADRLVIKAYLGFQELAIFSVGAKIAAVITLLTMGVQSALAPLVYARIDCADTPIKLRKILGGYILVGSAFLLVIGLLGKEVILFVAGNNYTEASSVAVILGGAVLIHGMCAFFPGLSIYKKTKLLACVNFIGAVFSVFMNFLLVIKWGVVGASFATLAGACVIFFMNAFFSQKYYKIF